MSEAEFAGVTTGVCVDTTGNATRFTTNRTRSTTEFTTTYTTNRTGSTTRVYYEPYETYYDCELIVLK